MEEKTKNHSTSIPETVIKDKRLTYLDKLIYGEIISLINENGCCDYKNSYFSEMYSCSIWTVSRSISKLSACGYFEVVLYFGYRKIYIKESNSTSSSLISEETAKEEVVKEAQNEIGNNSDDNITKMLPECSASVSRVFQECSKNVVAEYSGNGIEKDNIPAAKIPKTDFEYFANTYNKFCINFPRVSKLSEKRKTAIRKFIKELNQAQFEEVCKKANDISFLLGDNDRNWRADFDFIIRVDKAINILEGKYDNLGYNNPKDKIKVSEDYEDDGYFLS